MVFTATQANAGFFYFFFPSSGTIERLEGKKGQNCVGPGAKVGDQLHSVNGDVLTIKSLSGTSARCKKPEEPILAEMEFTVSTSFSAKAGLYIPDGYISKPLTNIQQFNGGLLIAKNDSTDSGVFVTSVKREVVSDLDTYANNLRTNQTKSLDDAKQTTVEKLNVNGLEARRFETDGKVRNLFGTRYTYVSTILQGDHEVVMINAWTPTAKYPQRKPELLHFSESVTGLSSAQSDGAVSEHVQGDLETNQASPEITSDTDKKTSTEADKSASEKSTESGTAADRLRRLNDLYKDGLIDKADFDAKKAEILKSL